MSDRSATTTRAGAAVLVVLVAACGAGVPDTETVREADPTVGVTVYARAVLNALDRGDTSALRALRLTEREHNDVIWPELPAGKPPINFPVDEAWANIQRRNERALRRIGPFFRESGVELESAACEGREVFDSFTVHTACTVAVRLRDGRRYRMTVFKDVVERSGAWRAFRYYDEPGPEPLDGRVSAVRNR